MSPDPGALMASAQRGDRRAFDDLVRVFWKGIYGYALRSLGDPDQAADVTQDTFVRAWRYRSSFTAGTGSVRGWLYAIAANRLRSAWGRSDPQPVEDLSWVPTRDPGGLEAYSRGVLREQVLATLEGLEPRQREVVALRYLSGLTYSEIAQALEITVSAAKMRALRARDVLTRRLARLLESGEGS